MHKAAFVSILLLHGATGQEIMVNTSMITSLHARQAAGPNKHLTDKVNCLINTADGKFVSVIESCAEVTRQIEGAR